jgi:hypothetical protein
MLALLSWLGTGCRVEAELQPQEAGLLALIEDLQSEQAESRESFQLLPCEIPYESGPRACYSRNVRRGELSIGEVHLRPQPGAAALVELRGVGPGCIRLDAIRERFQGGNTDNGCSHGVCRYYSVKSASGLMAFRLPDTARAPQCVSDVVLNSPN